MKFVEQTSEPLLAFADWQALDASARRNSGVIVPNDTGIEILEAALLELPLIALRFPKWTDGRAYSQARLLRSRYRYTGELRATGEVLVDMLPLLARTGFSQVQLRVDQNVEVARSALGFFAGHYQGDVRQPQPWFIRKAA